MSIKTPARKLEIANAFEPDNQKQAPLIAADVTTW